MPIFEEALDLHDLPLELKYLPVIESALNPMATSRQGAVAYGSSCWLQVKFTDCK